MARAIIVLAIGAVFSATAVSPRPLYPQAPPAIEQFERWMAAIERHVPGTADAPAVTVSSWSMQELGRLLVDVRTLAALVAQPAERLPFNPTYYTSSELTRRLRVIAGDRAAAAVLLERGAILHTDIAMLIPSEGTGRQETSASEAWSTVVLVADGRAIGFEYAGLHWALARMLLGPFVADPAARDRVRLWYRATAAHLQGRSELGHATAQVERARQLFPNDAVILFLSGCLHETLAGPRIQHAIQTTTLPGRMRFDIASADTSFHLAATFFRAALAIDPGLAEARIRLGRVLGHQGQHEQAVRELERAIADAQENVLLYYGWLFLGHERLVLADRREARRAFERAAAIFPRAQSPRLALSAVARAEGDREGGRRELAAILGSASSDDERHDPWWEYDQAQARHASADLADLWKSMLTRAVK